MANLTSTETFIQSLIDCVKSKDEVLALAWKGFHSKEDDLNYCNAFQRASKYQFVKL